MAEPYIEPSVDQIARRIRDAFIEEKTQQLRKPYRPNPRFDQMKFYRDAAQNVIQLRCDPCDFVRAAILYCGVKGGPFPNQLGSSFARGWYQQHAAAVGIQERRVARDPLAKAEEVEVFEVTSTCDVELQDATEVVLRTLYNNTGSADPKTPENLEILRNPFYELPVSALALMGDSVTLKKFGQQIYDFYKTQPNYLDAARRRKFPIDAVLNWINAQLIHDI